MNFIPLPYYSLIYFQFLLIVVVILFINSFQTELSNSNSLKSKNAFGIVILFLVTLYLGLRPVSDWFGDMYIYNIEFQKYVNGAPFDAKKDLAFEVMKFYFAKYLNAKTFFFTCAFLYVYLLYDAAKKMFQDYWFYGFMMFIVAFTFWAYGSNGIRNGLATSFFLYAISRDKKLATIVLLIITFLIHKGLMIPIIAFIIARYYTNTKVYIGFWILAIPLSLALGGFWENFFLSLGFADEKLDTYLTTLNQANEGVTLNIGFRWDFLLYSATGIFAGWYYIFKKQFEDVFYHQIYNTYIITNALWILVIRANYSNRFAFLSWFMLGLVLIYPLLKSQLVNKQHQLIGKILFGYFGFCYLMNVILTK